MDTIETSLANSTAGITIPVGDDHRARAMDWFCRRVGGRYAGCSFDNFEAPTADQQEALRLVQSYAEQLQINVRKGVNLLLVGPKGTGKDHLMTSLCMQTIKRGGKVEWFDGLDLFARIRASIGKGAGDSREVGRCTDAQVLAISDPLPPGGGLSDYELVMLFRIIDRRYRDRRPTWLTINAASREDAERRLAPNIVDRLVDGAVVVPCNWPSYRRRDAQGGQGE